MENRGFGYFSGRSVLVCSRYKSVMAKGKVIFAITRK